MWDRLCVPFAVNSGVSETPVLPNSHIISVVTKYCPFCTVAHERVVKGELGLIFVFVM